MIKPANDYIGQVIHYGDRRHFTVTDGPALEISCIVATDERGHYALLAVRVDENGDIVRAATEHGAWRDVTVTPAA